MQLHDFNKISFKKGRRPTRVGRGGKRGTTSGRGQKGQKSRSGHKIRPAERDLINRLPKLRGFANKPVSKFAVAINLSDIEKKFKKYAAGKHAVVVNREALIEARLLSKNYRGPVKILGKGAITIPLNLKGIKVSAAAKVNIEKAGGKVE